MFNIGETYERLIFILMVFLMICHFMACFWIFTADLSKDVVLDEFGKPVDIEQNNWIIDNNFEELGQSLLYSTAIYFTVTTITTVGYGDISGTNATERIICCFLMILGVVFFSFSSGTLTSMISNQDTIKQKHRMKELLLNKIYKDYSISSELYY